MSNREGSFDFGGPPPPPPGCCPALCRQRWPWEMSREPRRLGTWRWSERTSSPCAGQFSARGSRVEERFECFPQPNASERYSDTHAYVITNSRARVHDVTIKHISLMFHERDIEHRVLIHIPIYICRPHLFTCLILPADGLVAMTTAFQGQGQAGYPWDSGQGGVGFKIRTFSPGWITLNVQIQSGCSSILLIAVLVRLFPAWVGSHSACCCFSSFQRLSTTLMIKDNCKAA